MHYLLIRRYLYFFHQMVYAAEQRFGIHLQHEKYLQEGKVCEEIKVQSILCTELETANFKIILDYLQ